jgi:predicted transcriptional regulator
VYVYLSIENGYKFIEKFSSAILYAYLKSLKLTNISGQKPKELLRTAMKYCPETVSSIDMALEARDTDLSRSFEQLVNIPTILSKETDSKPIIILDEFQRLVDYNYISAIDIFRENIMHQPDVWWIISGSSIGMMQRLVSEADSPLYSHFEKVFVPPFDYENSRKFIRMKFKKDDLVIGDVNTSLLVSISGGYPFYLDILTFAISDLAIERGHKKISNIHIIDAIANELFSTQGTLYSHISEFIENSLDRRGFATYIDLMVAIAKGAHTSSEIARGAHIKASSLSRYLRNLIEVGIVRKSGSVYTLIDPLLKLWLKYVFTLREDDYIPEIGIKLDMFKSNIEQMITAYKQENGKGVEARVRELFRAFDGRISLHEKKLPKFDEVEQRVIRGAEFDIAAQYKNGYWFVEVKTSPVSSKMVRNFASKVAGSNMKVEEKIMVATSGIDSKAMSLAIEEGIWVWGIEDVNFLMKLYEKFPILI